MELELDRDVNVARNLLLAGWERYHQQKTEPALGPGRIKVTPAEIIERHRTILMQ